MEIGFQAVPQHAHGLFHPLFIVHDVFLGDHVDDLLPGAHVQVVHVVQQGFHILPADLIVVILTDDPAAVLQAFNVLPGNADIHVVDVHPGFVGCLFDGCFYGIDRVLDVGYHAPFHPDGFSPAVAEDLNFAVFVFPAYDGRDLGGSDVEPDDDV